MFFNVNINHKFISSQFYFILFCNCFAVLHKNYLNYSCVWMENNFAFHLFCNCILNIHINIFIYSTSNNYMKIIMK